MVLNLYVKFSKRYFWTILYGINRQTTQQTQLTKATTDLFMGKVDQTSTKI